MTKHIFRLLILGAAIAAAAACAPPQPKGGDVEAVKSAIADGDQKFVALLASGDAAGIAQMYTADGMVMPAGSDAITGREAIEKFFQDAIASGMRTMKLESLTVDTAGDLALETGTYEITDANGGHVDHGKFLVSWKRDNGAWKIDRDIWTTSMPAPTVTQPTGPPGSGEGAATPFSN